MRHKVRGKKLGRRKEHRAALLCNLSKSIVAHGRVVTTLAKAKAVRPVLEKLITRGKNSSLHSRRLLLSFFRGDDVAVKQIVDVTSRRFNERSGGYLRISKAGFRKGDNAPMGVIQFV